FVSHAIRFSQPAKRKGSEGISGVTSSFIHTAPSAVAGPNSSGSVFDVNHKLEFDCPGPSMSPFAFRLFKNSRCAESSHPNTSPPPHRVKSPITFRYADRGRIPALLVALKEPGNFQNIPCMVII